MENKFIVLFGNEVSHQEYMDVFCKILDNIEEKAYQEYTTSKKENPIHMICEFGEANKFSSAEELIKKNYYQYLVIILINKETGKTFLYKGTDLDKIESIYLPIITDTYPDIFKSKNNYPQTVEDVREYNIFYLSNCLN